jgi:hypothetical protein
VTTYADYVARMLSGYGAVELDPPSHHPVHHCKACEVSACEDICFACGLPMKAGLLPKGQCSPSDATQAEARACHTNLSASADLH